MFASQLELLAALEQALTAEIAALRARDVEALDRAVEKKRSTLTTLGRSRTVGRDGDPATAEAVELLRRCRALNDVAGGAIAVLRQDVAQALGLLGVESQEQGYGAERRPVRAGRALGVC